MPFDWLFSPPPPASLRVIWLSPSGNDAGTGTAEAPLRTLEAAQEAARSARMAQPGPVHVVLKAGRYELERPLVFGPEDGGTSQADEAVWRAADGEEVLISGGVTLGPWQREGSPDWIPLWRSPALPDPSLPLWRAALPAGAAANQLWLCGERATRARHPNAGTLRWERPLPAPFGAWGLVYEAGQGLEAMGEALVEAEAVVFHSWTASRHTVTQHLPERRTLLFARMQTCASNAGPEDWRVIGGTRCAGLAPGQSRATQRSARTCARAGAASTSSTRPPSSTRQASG